MKYLFFLILFLSFFFVNCNKLLPDLPRDNKADSAYTGYDSDKIRKLDYYTSNVACRYPKDSYFSSEDNIILAGDRVYLNVTVKNNCNNDIEMIRASFSSSSNFIHIIQPTNDFYVRFSYDSYTDNIPAWDIGTGEITNGSYYLFAPNSNSYSVEFTVDTNVVSESTFILLMKLTDKFNNSWNSNISLTVK